MAWGSPPDITSRSSACSRGCMGRAFPAQASGLPFASGSWNATAARSGSILMKVKEPPSISRFPPRKRGRQARDPESHHPVQLEKFPNVRVVGFGQILHRAEIDHAAFIEEHDAVGDFVHQVE